MESMTMETTGTCATYAVALDIGQTQAQEAFRQLAEHIPHARSTISAAGPSTDWFTKLTTLVADIQTGAAKYGPGVMTVLEDLAAIGSLVKSTPPQPH